MKRVTIIPNIMSKSPKLEIPPVAKKHQPSQSSSPAKKAAKDANNRRLALCYFLLITSTVFGFGGFGFGLGIRYTHLWDSGIFFPQNSSIGGNQSP